MALEVNLELSAQLGEDDNDDAVASAPPPPTDPKPAAAAAADTPASGDTEAESSITDLGSLSFNLFVRFPLTTLPF